MGTVYLAHDTVRGDRVALKVIRADRMTSQAVARLQQEFQAVASLNHPQIAVGYDFGYTESGLPFYTREYVDGVPLPPGPPDDRSPLEYLRPILDVADALSYLHENDILHLDIHAGNLILSEDPERGSVLIDFGFTGSLDGSLYTRFDCRSLALPPELLHRSSATPQTDVFLVGRLLHYRLAGRMEGEVRLPREIPGWGPRLTLDLERIATKAMQPLATHRFQSARELREALARALGTESSPSRAARPRNVTFGRDRELDAIEA